MSELYDITIVGGGPVGLFAAFYAHLRQAKVQIIDSLPQLGGQPAILYPEKQILDVPGFPNLTGEELTNRLIEQLDSFDTPIYLNETVLEIEKKMVFLRLQLLKEIILVKLSLSLWEVVLLNRVHLNWKVLKVMKISTITFLTFNNMQDRK